jgi:hypothetical protein
MRAFAMGVWGQVTDKIVDVCGVLIVIIKPLHDIGLSFTKLLLNRWEVIADAVYVLCLLVVWHAFRSAFSVASEIKREESLPVDEPRPWKLVSPSGEPIYGSVPVSNLYSFPRAKLYGVASCLALLAMITSCFTWKWSKETVVIETRTPDESNPHESDDGFLQPERIELFCGPRENFKMTLGDPIRLDVHYFNRGSKPIEAAYLSVQPRIVLALATHPNLDAEMRSAFRTATDQEYATGEIEGKGSKVPSGGELWNTGYSEPLTLESINGLKKGTWRLYYLSRAIWKNNNGAKSDYLVCSWSTNIPDTPGRKPLTMHNCD